MLCTDMKLAEDRSDRAESFVVVVVGRLVVIVELSKYLIEELLKRRVVHEHFPL